MDTNLDSGDGSGRTIAEVVEDQSKVEDAGADGTDTRGDVSSDYVAPEVTEDTSAEEQARIEAEQQAAREVAEQAERERQAAEEQARIDAEREAEQEAARQREAEERVAQEAARQQAAQEEQDAADWAAGEFDLGGGN